MSRLWPRSSYGQGHEVRLLAPYDPDDRLARVLHRGARRSGGPLPDYLIPLGRTFGLPMNGAVSNLSSSPEAIGVLGRELRTRRLRRGARARAERRRWSAGSRPRRRASPTVGTFHTYSTSWLPNTIAANVVGARRLYSKLSARIAVSEAAEWTARRFYGGRYRIVPNGVDLSRRPARPARPATTLEILFVGRAEGRKGLPVLLRAFEALRGAGVDARLTVAGATDEEVEPLLLDTEGVEIAGRVTEEEKWRLLGAGRPALRAVARRRELRHGAHRGVRVRHPGRRLATSPATATWSATRQDGLLVPAGDAGRAGRGAARPRARPRAARSAWRARRASAPSASPGRSVAARGHARSTRRRSPSRSPRRRAARAGHAASGCGRAEPGPRVRPRRLPSLEPKDGAQRPAPPRRAWRAAARVVGGARGRRRPHRAGARAASGSSRSAARCWPPRRSGCWSRFALMCALDAGARRGLARDPARRAARACACAAATPRAATMIGVLMSATLPARLGEPSRALIVARRLGRMRDRFPVVLGTIVSQTLLNILALVRARRGHVRDRRHLPRRARTRS